ncbi:MAG: PKD domain-containing protein, partial [Candidatus Gracilibacteria bacterium]|nr:PKD domain-containing protein [Candidatus Gracilibacteria bacterium]
MYKKLLLLSYFLVLVFGFNLSTLNVYATSSNTNTSISIEEFGTLRDIDIGTFNEFRYRIVNEYFNLKSGFEVNSKMDITSLNNMEKFAKDGINYVDDTLINKNILSSFTDSIEKAKKSLSSEVLYREVVSNMDKYIKEIRVGKITGNITASPSSGNAPLNTTLRGNVNDPSGTIIPNENYVWWINQGGAKKVIGRGITLNYTFLNEGNHSVFLDVISNHKNKNGKISVLPFSSRINVSVESRIASIIIKVNQESLYNYNEIKFTPEEAIYGLIIDATASTPTGGAKFRSVEWDFGNGITKKYDGDPRLERVTYGKEGTFNVELKLITNEGKFIERKFNIVINKPIATISSNIETGFIGDNFVFTAKSTVNNRNLSYTWYVLDTKTQKTLVTKNGNILNHVFKEKGRYVVQLEVNDVAGNKDLDTKVIDINSRPPIANFTSIIPLSDKPNKVLLDGTKSSDLDISDQGKLTYKWIINGKETSIDYLNDNGSIGYYTFNSIGDQNIVLEVTDPDGLVNTSNSTVRINSVLDVDFGIFPRIAKRGNLVKFIGNSSNAKYFEWDFGDTETSNTVTNSTSHVFKNSGIYTVNLKVGDLDGKENSISKKVYVQDADRPVAVIDLAKGDSTLPVFKTGVCSGQRGAYIVDRVSPVLFNGNESVDINGSLNGLTYTWKIGNDKIFSGKSTNYRFQELGCFPVSLTVTSGENKKTSTDTIWVKVENLKPTLSSLNIQPVDLNTDPVVVNLTAVGAKDPDGVIQSYIWYYYTDTDPYPQDYRITTQPLTTFVLPKITGNYYFVVVMKDNNDERYTSKESDSSSYFISLTGDNVNTPLIDLKVNNNSVNVGDEVIFSSIIKDVLGNNISSKVEYSWDFDGDGFYDNETKNSTVSHVFKNSGTFYAKLRVKHRGFTNVRSIEINVANILKPDFEYISIGDKYLFFNTSKGTFDNVVFEMPNGDKILNKNYFIYEVKDNKPLGEVILKISEGNKMDSKIKIVSRDMKNFINYNTSSGVLIYSMPNLTGDKFSLDEQKENLIIYLPKKDPRITNISLDYDLDLDTTLTGEFDDDIDNINSESYINGGFFEIPLNNNKIQKIRVSYYSGEELIDSKDYLIEKNYIEQLEIDLNTLEFNGVSDFEKEKIEKLKSFVSSLDKQYRFEGMKFIQRLQEEWFYDTEKTKIILDFTKFIDALKNPKSSEMVALLEGLLVEGQEDKSI